MASKSKTFLEYRYDKSEAWKVYDWTQVPRRVESLFSDMQREHPDAEYRKVKR